MTTDSTARFQKLISRLKSPHDLKRIHAGLLLGRMGQGAREAVPTLLELLQEESIQNRKPAAWILGNIGHGAVTFSNTYGFRWSTRPEWGSPFALPLGDEQVKIAATVPAALGGLRKVNCATQNPATG